VLANKVDQQQRLHGDRDPHGGSKARVWLAYCGHRRAAKSKLQKFARSVGGGTGLGFRTALTLHLPRLSHYQSEIQFKVLRPVQPYSVMHKAYDRWRSTANCVWSRGCFVPWLGEPHWTTPTSFA